MQHSLAAIRGGRSQTRYATTAARSRLPRLGLCRPSFAPVGRSTAITVGGPRDELRRAARSCITPPTTAAAGPFGRHGLRRRGDGVSWARPVDGTLRHARPRSAAPWRA